MGYNETPLPKVTMLFLKKKNTVDAVLARQLEDLNTEIISIESQLIMTTMLLENRLKMTTVLEYLYGKKEIYVATINSRKNSSTK